MNALGAPWRGLRQALLPRRQVPRDHVGIRRSSAGQALDVHGLNDPRCPVSQSRLFRDKLLTLGRREGEEFDDIELAEEGHGSADIEQKIRTFWILADYLERVLEAAAVLRDEMHNEARVARICLSRGPCTSTTASDRRASTLALPGGGAGRDGTRQVISPPTSNRSRLVTAIRTPDARPSERLRQRSHGDPGSRRTGPSRLGRNGRSLPRLPIARSQPQGEQWRIRSSAHIHRRR